MTRNLILAAVALPIAATFTSAAPTVGDFTPSVAYSQPVGSAHHDWAAGYGLGLTYNTGVQVAGWSLGARLGFSRWTPNDAELLNINGREFTTEKKEGWLAAGDLSLLAQRELMRLPLGMEAILGEVGVGLAYLRNSDVTVKGYAPVAGTNTALVHYAFKAAEVRVAPVASAGIGLKITSSLKMLIAANHYFASEPISVAQLGVVLLPQ